MSSDFDRLQPEVIFDAIEEAGFRATGEYSQLNSYENRVFDVRLEPSAAAPAPLDRVIAKFYRPRRWSRQAIEDEHAFLADLGREGIPAVAPLVARGGGTTVEHEGFLLSLFPRVAGRMPQEFLGGELRQVGRTLARIHNVGARRPARHRPSLVTESFGWNCLPVLERYVYPELYRRYCQASAAIFEFLDDRLEPARYLRIHGDCHKGNLLHDGREFFFVDFDDFVNGPEVQDFWMLLSGSLQTEDAEREQEEICLGYEELRGLPDDWDLFEPLRGLRIVSYAHWIAQRWGDPFFKQIFPAFESYNYWLEETNVLERIAGLL
jgi:Ser/Thr protein kinase RdoA (MazF antagonist)